MSKNFNICCPECFSKNLYKYGKDKTGKQKYQCKTCHSFKSETSVQTLLQGFFFFYNYIIPHSSLNGETPTRVAGVKYSELQRSNLLLF